MNDRVPIQPRTHLVKSTCCYCGTGCGVLIETDGRQVLGVQGDPEHPANFGRLCTKGATLHLSARADVRLLHPELRQERGAMRQRASWDETLDHLAQRFAAIIRQHGPDAVAFYVSGQLLTEDYYVFNKLAKGLIGTNNIDTNSRLCMSSAVAGYKATLGADAPPACYQDIDHADCLFISGSNTAFAHPIVFRRIEDARRRKPQQKLIVVDPRRTDTAAEADLHLAILPGTDVALYNAMLHVMLWEGWVDQTYIRAHTEGFEAVKAMVREFTPEMAAQICGVPAADIIKAAEWFATAPATLSLYCQGLNQSIAGTDKNIALINLHLATGQIGRAGSGPFSLTGQPNAMGGREVGGMANLLSAHRDLANPQHRAEIARFWGVERVPEAPGKSAVEMFEALRSGQIKAIWIAGTNPAQSMPNQAAVRAALQQAELVVVQEAYRQTDTSSYADVLLPASSWGEKEGTVTNSERRITHLHAAVPAAGEARADWQIAAEFGQRLARELGADAKLMDYTHAAQVFAEHCQSTRGRDLDISGLDYATLDQAGPQQWPFPPGATTGRARLYEDGVFATVSGRARFVATPFRPLAEDSDARFPLRLNTGRLRDQWHGMSRSGTVARLFAHVEEPMVAMHAQDMQRRNLQDGDFVRLRSRRGELVVRAFASDEQRPAQVFLPMHWGGQFLKGLGTNALTLSAVDPVSRQPELKHAAVEIDRLELPWQMLVMRRGDALRRLQLLQPLLERFEYASAGLFGRDEPVLIFRAAATQPISDEVLCDIDRRVGLDDDTQAMTYADRKRGVSKRILVEHGLLAGVRLTGETAARDWLKELMAQGASAASLRTWVLAPVTQPPVGQSRRGRIICNCLDVSEGEIAVKLKEGADFAVVQQKLKCGTQCGSCVPELKRLCAGAAASPASRPQAR